LFEVGELLTELACWFLEAISGAPNPNERVSDLHLFFHGILLLKVLGPYSETVDPEPYHVRDKHSKYWDKQRGASARQERPVAGAGVQRLGKRKPGKTL